MDIYQQSRIKEFFSQYSRVCQEDCHRFVRNVLVRQLYQLPGASFDVEPSDYQGCFSYTCIIKPQNPASASIVIQFRYEPLVWSMEKANQIHGKLVPQARSEGCFEGLFMYASQFIPGTPYAAVLMAAEQDLPQNHRLTTISDLADIVARGAKRPIPSQPLSVSKIESIIDNYSFKIRNLKSRILFCLSEIQQHSASLAKLPIVLTHIDLTPFNYLIDESSGHITGVLDWDGAYYLPIGHNFHFIEQLLGNMTRDGWEDIEDRHMLESFFYARLRQQIVSEGFEEDDLEAIEYEKALGNLTYYIPKLLEWKDGKAEKYLEGFLRNLSFLKISEQDKSSRCI
ncbi:hypothetical protein B7494_g8364 [Chlorociboria aeruginascens]|nr:hypothetical protein B7494_g8364 [Chlorociboria aeruginascens]